MITDSTVFVLGAGASVAYGLPGGDQLRDQICENVLSDAYIETLNSKQIEQARTLADQLRVAGLQIDAWLARRPEYIDIGKFLIARTILAAESPEAIATVRPLKAEEKERRRKVDWYSELWKRLLPPTVDRLGDNRVAFVTFNYDRSLETMLMMKMRTTFGAPMEVCAEHIAKLPLVHVHGQLGRLPWQVATDERKSMSEQPYEQSEHPAVAARCAPFIKILSEAQAGDAAFECAKRLFKQAKRIHFLGFGYHDENLGRLKCEGLERKVTISGTWYGIEDWRRQRLNNSDNPFACPIRMYDPYKTVMDYVTHEVDGWPT